MFRLRYADAVSLGDEVLVEGNNVLTPARVTNVSKLTLQGNQYFLTCLFCSIIYYIMFIYPVNPANNVT